MTFHFPLILKPLWSTYLGFNSCFKVVVTSMLSKQLHVWYQLPSVMLHLIYSTAVMPCRPDGWIRSLSFTTKHAACSFINRYKGVEGVESGSAISGGYMYSQRCLVRETIVLTLQNNTMILSSYNIYQSVDWKCWTFMPFTSL